MQSLVLQPGLLESLEYLPRDSIGIAIVQAMHAIQDGIGDDFEATFNHEVPRWLQEDGEPTMFRMTLSTRPALRGGWELYVKKAEYLPDLRITGQGTTEGKGNDGKGTRTG